MIVQYPPREPLESMRELLESISPNSKQSQSSCTYFGMLIQIRRKYSCATLSNGGHLKQSGKSMNTRNSRESYTQKILYVHKVTEMSLITAWKPCSTLPILYFYPKNVSDLSTVRVCKWEIEFTQCCQIKYVFLACNVKSAAECFTAFKHAHSDAHIRIHQTTHPPAHTCLGCI